MAKVVHSCQLLEAVQYFSKSVFFIQASMHACLCVYKQTTETCQQFYYGLYKLRSSVGIIVLMKIKSIKQDSSLGDSKIR